MTEITWSDVGYKQGQVAESCCTQDRKGISTNVLLYAGGLSCINGELFFFLLFPTATSGTSRRLAESAFYCQCPLD